MGYKAYFTIISWFATLLMNVLICLKKNYEMLSFTRGKLLSYLRYFFQRKLCEALYYAEKVSSEVSCGLQCKVVSKNVKAKNFLHPQKVLELTNYSISQRLHLTKDIQEFLSRKKLRSHVKEPRNIPWK